MAGASVNCPTTIASRYQTGCAIAHMYQLCESAAACRSQEVPHSVLVQLDTAEGVCGLFRPCSTLGCWGRLSVLHTCMKLVPGLCDLCCHLAARRPDMDPVCTANLSIICMMFPSDQNSIITLMQHPLALLRPLQAAARQQPCSIQACRCLLSTPPLTVISYIGHSLKLPQVSLELAAPANHAYIDPVEVAPCIPASRNLLMFLSDKNAIVHWKPTEPLLLALQPHDAMPGGKR